MLNSKSKLKIHNGGKGSQSTAEVLPSNVICYKQLMRTYRTELSKLYDLVKRGYLPETSDRIKNKLNNISKLKVWSSIQLSGMNRNLKVKGN